MPDTVSIGIEGQAPPPTYLQRLATRSLIEGARSEDWWQKQSADAQFRFTRTLRAGLARNATTDELARDVRSQMEITTRAATALVRTSVQQVAADARRETFQRNSDVIAGVKHISTFDSRTSDVCLAYGSDSATGDGAEYDLDYEPINGTKLPYDEGVPRHWNCRSVEVAITKSWEELGMEAPEDYPEFQPQQSGDDWMREQTQEIQNELLGATRAQLWRDGKVSLIDLLDQHGNALSAEQLEAKYGGATLHQTAVPQEAVDYVVQHGIDKGNDVEYGYALAQDGKKLFAGVGLPDCYPFSAKELQALLDNPGVTFVHNHSLNGSLSVGDVVTGHVQNMESIIAAGHDGSMYTASGFSKDWTPQDIVIAYRNADSIVSAELAHDGALEANWRATSHLDNLMLSKLGAYKYVATPSPDMQRIVDMAFEILKRRWGLSTDAAIISELARRAMPTMKLP